MLKSNKMQKSCIFGVKLIKKRVFRVSTQTLIECFIPKNIAISLKNYFLPMKSCESFWLWVKGGLKYFAQLYSKFATFSPFCIFQLFCTKNAKNNYFDQRLGCAAPKCWSKYTTGMLCFFKQNFKMYLLRSRLSQFSTY